MDKDQVAAILDEIGTLLELQGENSFRCNAYHNAARAIEQLEDQPRRRRRRRASSARFPASAKPCATRSPPWSPPASCPSTRTSQEERRPACSRCCACPASGPRRSRPCTISSASTTSTSSRPPARPAEVAELKGFGDKTQQKILEGIALPRPDRATRPARPGPAAGPRRCWRACASCPGIIRMELCGSLPAAQGNHQGHRHPHQLRRRRRRSWSAS